MPINLTAVSGKARTPRLELDQIPPDVATAVEEAYEYNLENPAERLQGEFGTQDAAEAFLHAARSYAYARPAGRLVVTGNTTEKGFARFRVTPYTEATGEAANGTGEPPVAGGE